MHLSYRLLYIDNVLIFAGTEPLADSVVTGTKMIWLGSRSYGYAGKSYHDWVRLTR